MRSLIRFLVICISAAALPACSKGPSLPALFPVKGKVTLNDQPVTSGQVSLIPNSPEGSGELSVAVIDASGNYEVKTSGEMGAPVGKYKVTITPSMVPMGGGTPPPGGGMPKSPFDPVYMDTQKTPLTIEVVENPAPGAYDLKLKASAAKSKN